MNKIVIAVISLVTAGTAQALEDPLDATVTQQAIAVAPGAEVVGPFFKAADKKTDWTVVLETGKCYWWSGAAGGNVKKLALYLWGPDRKRVTDAKSGGPLATMTWCPTVAGPYHFQAKLEGQGIVSVGLYQKAAPQVAAPPPPPPTLDLPALIAQAAASAAPGAQLVGALLEGAGDKSEWAPLLEAGKCYWFVGAGEPGHVKALSLYLWGPDGKRITESKGSTASSMVGHCTTQPGIHKVQAKVTSGGGRFAVGVYAKAQ